MLSDQEKQEILADALARREHFKILDALPPKRGMTFDQYLQWVTQQQKIFPPGTWHEEWVTGENKL